MAGVGGPRRRAAPHFMREQPKSLDGRHASSLEIARDRMRGSAAVGALIRA